MVQINVGSLAKKFQELGLEVVGSCVYCPEEYEQLVRDLDVKGLAKKLKQTKKRNVSDKWKEGLKNSREAAKIAKRNNAIANQIKTRDNWLDLSGNELKAARVRKCQFKRAYPEDYARIWKEFDAIQEEVKKNWKAL